MSLSKIIQFPRQPKVIKIAVEHDKSCKSCDHFRVRRTGWEDDTCMHFPQAILNDVNKEICTPDNRKYWTEKHRGLLGRFFRWLF